MFIGPVFDTAGDVGEKLVRDVRNDHPDGVRLAAAEHPRRVVGLVVELVGYFQDALRGLSVDPVVLLPAVPVAHHERYQGDGYARFRSNVLDGYLACRHNLRCFCKIGKYSYLCKGN